MARLNFEDSLFKKPGFQKLMIRLGNRHQAMGMVLDLWSLAQKHWFPDRRPIPIEAFQEADLSPILIECGLAEGVDGGIYAKGSEDAFAWLFEAAEKGKKGGLASAEARKKKTGSAQPKKPKTKKPENVEPQVEFLEAQVNHSQAQVNPPEASFSLLSTPLSLLSSQDSNLLTHNSSCTVLAPAKPVLTELVEFKSEREVLSAIPNATRDRWIKLYPDAEFLQREALKAFNWYDNNPKKKPRTARGWVTALSSWFERGWRTHVRTIKPEAGSGVDWAKVFGESGGAA